VVLGGGSVSLRGDNFPDVDINGPGIIGSMIGIYQIVNTKNNKRYIGQSIDVLDRLAHHRNSLIRGCHDNEHLLRSWNKYGGGSFRFEPLLTCSVEHLTFFEQEAYDFLNPIYGCYNEGPILENQFRGRTHSEESKQKISASKQNPSEEIRLKLRKAKGGENHPFWGKFGENSANWGSRWNLSEETKIKMSIAQIGNTKWLGKRHSEKTKQKISAARKAWWAKRKSGGVPSDS